jgi:hypothetical protein
MIKIKRHAYSEFFQKIIDFADLSFLKFKIDLELNISKSEFANFVLVFEFDGFFFFFSKSVKYMKTQK